jgi:hypothetical protein
MNDYKLQSKTAWVEDRATVRTDPSTDPGAKTEERAVGMKRVAARLPLRDWHESDKPSRHDAVTLQQEAPFQLANGERLKFLFTVNQDNAASKLAEKFQLPPRVCRPSKG